MRDQIISVVGAVLILAAYAALQAGRLRYTSRRFCLMNAIGSGLLTWVAIVGVLLAIAGNLLALRSKPGTRNDPKTGTLA